LKKNANTIHFYVSGNFTENINMNIQIKYYLELNNLSANDITINDEIHRCTDTTKNKANSDGWYSVIQKNDGVILNLGSWYSNFTESYFISNDGSSKKIGEYTPVPTKTTPTLTPTANTAKVDWVKKWQRAKSYGVN